LERAQRRAERLPPVQHGLEEIALAPHALEDGIHRERCEIELRRQLSPAQGRGDRRPRPRPGGVRGCDRLPPPVLPVIDEDAAPLLLQPLGRQQAGVLGLEPARDELGELVGLVEAVSPGDRDKHRRDLAVVVEEIALRDALSGPENTVGARQPDFSFFRHCRSIAR
jgi:hypothetical protein